VRLCFLFVSIIHELINETLSFWPTKIRTEWNTGDGGHSERLITFLCFLCFHNFFLNHHTMSGNDTNMTRSGSAYIFYQTKMTLTWVNWLVENVFSDLTSANGWDRLSQHSLPSSHQMFFEESFRAPSLSFPIKLKFPSSSKNRKSNKVKGI
jgi:hypothetical protein